MKNSLHITNGDCAVNGLRAAGILGELLAWRDVLHIGPIKKCNRWYEFDQMRADFLISNELAQREQIESSFKDRQAVMNQLQKYDQIYLWFEHDLYDQLQMLHILMCIQDQPDLHGRTKLIVSDLYLGTASDDDYQQLFRYSERLSEQHLSAAHIYWQALTNESPVALTQLPKVDCLPFLLPAFNRLCAEFPYISNGLNQVENTLLFCLVRTTDPKELFELYQQTEEARFMGDSIFALVLLNLLKGEMPLIAVRKPKQSVNHHSEIWNHEIEVTETGKLVMQQQRHHLKVNKINKWVGGVHLTSASMWCYDNLSNQFIKWGRDRVINS